jgi:hypothetical protein
MGAEAKTLLSASSLKSNGQVAKTPKKKAWWESSTATRERADRALGSHVVSPHAVRGRGPEAEAKSQGYY